MRLLNLYRMKEIHFHFWHILMWKQFFGWSSSENWLLRFVWSRSRQRVFLPEAFLNQRHDRRKYCSQLHQSTDFVAESILLRCRPVSGPQQQHESVAFHDVRMPSVWKVENVRKTLCEENLRFRWKTKEEDQATQQLSVKLWIPVKVFSGSVHNTPKRCAILQTIVEASLLNDKTFPIKSKPKALTTGWNAKFPPEAFNFWWNNLISDNLQWFIN